MTNMKTKMINKAIVEAMTDEELIENSGLIAEEMELRMKANETKQNETINKYFAGSIQRFE